MADSTWETEELWLLEAIRNMEVVEPGRPPYLQEAVAGTGLDMVRAYRAVVSLVQDEYLRAEHIDPSSAYGITLTPRGRRAIGQWPSGDAYSDLMLLLEQRIAITSDPVDRDRLQRLQDAIGDVGKSVTGAVLAALIQRNMNL